MPEMEEILAAEYEKWLKANYFAPQCAAELLFDLESDDHPNEKQIAWLRDFNRRWEMLDIDGDELFGDDDAGEGQELVFVGAARDPLKSVTHNFSPEFEAALDAVGMVQ